MTTLIYNCGDKAFTINLPNHHKAHEWSNGVPGSDPVTVYPRMFAHLRTTPISGQIRVNVSNFYWLENGVFKVFVGGTYNLTPHIPSTPDYVRLVALCFDTETEELVAVESDEVFDSAITPPSLPVILTSTYIPSALIRLSYGDTEIEEKDITDVRILLGNVGGSSSVSNLASLTDVSDTISPNNGSTLIYSGTEWVSGKILTDANGDIMVDANGDVLYA